MIELFNEDCMEGMKRYPDKHFDLAIVDPPYGIGNFVQITGNVRGDAVTWNDQIPTEDFFRELRRISKERIIWGANYYNCFEGNYGAIIWNKNNPNPQFSVCEIASYSRLKRVDYVSITWYGFKCDGRYSNHPCEKPIALYRWLLKNYAKKGDLILDTHLGSGSIAIACYDMGFDLVGFEIDKDYYEGAVKRIEENKRQGKLFHSI